MAIMVITKIVEEFEMKVHRGESNKMLEKKQGKDIKRK